MKIGDILPASTLNRHVRSGKRYFVGVEPRTGFPKRPFDGDRYAVKFRKGPHVLVSNTSNVWVPVGWFIDGWKQFYKTI